jgi:hypothetical protein
MLILDENISEIEVWRLREWRVAVRQIGPDLAKVSTTDENILPVLQHLKAPTFFTRDRDFWDATLRHRHYCLVFMDIPEHEGEVASAIRRFLRQRSFNTHAKRLGKVVRIHLAGIQFWQVGRQRLQTVSWEES